MLGTTRSLLRTSSTARLSSSSSAPQGQSAASQGLARARDWAKSFSRPDQAVKVTGDAQSSALEGLPRFEGQGVRLSKLRTSDPLFASVSTSAKEAAGMFPAAQVTTLPSGLRVATERVPTKTATVAVSVNAGSRNESASTNGVAHFLEHTLFKGSETRTQDELERMTEERGALLNAFTSRENTVYVADVTSAADVKWGIDTLADNILRPLLDAGAIERERSTIFREMEEVAGMTDEVVFDRLHETAYQDTAMGRTILGPEDNVARITRDDILSFVKTHYTGDNMVVSVVGDVDHAAVVKEVERAFASVPKTVPEGYPPVQKEAAYFTGSDIRIRYDSMDRCHIAYAFPTDGQAHPSSVPLMVMQLMLGTLDAGTDMGAAALSGAPLVSYAAQRRSAESIQPFHTAYSDTGLFGVYAVCEPRAVQEFMGTLSSEIASMAHNPTERTVEEAKNQTVAKVLAQHYESTSAQAEELGRQVLNYGRRLHPTEVIERIESVTVADVRNTAREYFYDRDFAMAAIGNTWELPDYNWLRRRTYAARY